MISNNTRPKYVPPSKRNIQSGPTDTKGVSKPINTLALNDTNFPALSPNKTTNNSKNKRTPSNPTVNTPTNLNFKLVAELAKDLPDPHTERQSDVIETSSDEKEVIDLTPFVRLQERRQTEYDALYGEGAFNTRIDKMIYDTFSEPSSESEQSEPSEDEDDLLDY